MKRKKIFFRLVTILITVTMCLVVLPQVSADSVGLVSEWDFDEGFGSTVIDAANGNDGTLSGGKFGNALEFSVLHARVDCGNDPSLKINLGTWEAWINFEAKPSDTHMMNPLAKTNQYWIHASDGTDDPLAPGTLTNADSIQVKITIGGVRYIATSGPNFIQTEVWYHVAGTYDGTDLKLYINGALIDTTTTPGGNIDAGTYNFMIGTWSTLTDDFIGKIDEVRVSNAARTTFDQTHANIVDGQTVGLWHLDESTGTIAEDETNNNDGIITGATWAGPTWTTGVSGSGLHFDGVDDYVKIPDDESLAPETITIECYVKSNVLEYYAYIISKDYTSGFGASSYAFYTGSTRGLYFYVKTSSGYALSPNAGTSIWDGEWHHIVGTYDGINPRLYVDEIEVTGTPGTGDDILYSATGNLLFGTYSEVFTHPTYDFYFNGDIDEVKIYNYAIDALNLAFDPTSDAVAPVNENANIRAVVTDGLGNTVEGITVTLDSTTLTLSTTSDETDSNGILAFTASSTNTGIYTITATISTPAGSLTDTWTLAIYDPSAGFVTGGGWIYSQAGAYVPDPDAEGKANFGFVSKYKKGQSIPEGNTEFQFNAGDLNFHSDSYEWLVITGGNKAMYKGIGTINNAGSYKFMITAYDDSPDTFRIKIWEEDEDGNEIVIYDNGTDTILGGGQIKIHSK